MGQTTEELNSEIAGTRQALSEDLDALQDKVSPSAVVQRRKQALTGRARSLRSRILGTGHSLSEGASSGAGGSASAVQGGAGGVAEAAEHRVEGSPLGAGLVAFGVGVVVAGLLPASEAEARASRKVVDTAKEHGQPVADAAKSAGQQMASTLQDKAADAASEVKETAQQSADRVKGETTDSAQRVRGEAT
jgi:gas vesicle protein